MNEIKIKINKKAGFCFGVKRAVELVIETLNTSKEKVFCWGDLIHNPVIMKELKNKGLLVIKDIKAFEKNAIFVVRSHGITLEDLKFVKKKTSKIIDTTCPFVNKAQKMAKEIKDKDLQVIILGDKDHVEVKGINSRTGNEAIIVNNLEDFYSVKDKLKNKKVGIVSQTTQKIIKFQSIIEAFKKENINFIVKDSICLDTTCKQEEITSLDSKKVDVLVVIGGLNSSNTTKLAEIGKDKKIKTYHIEKAQDIEKKWFKNNSNVIITAGASTHPKQLKEAKKIIKNFHF